MMLLRATARTRLPDSFQVRSRAAQAGVSTREESYDKASPFRGRKFRLRVVCCNTTAPPATNPRQGGCLLLLSAIRGSHGKSAPRTAAGWRSRQNAGKKARPTGRHAQIGRAHV